MKAGIRIDGLAQFRRDLKKIDEELAKELRGDLLLIAKDIASEAAGRVSSKSGRARGSVRAGVSGNNAYVAGGKASVPYYGWLDFGSRNPVSGRPRSVGPWKGSGHGPKMGRYLYPTIARNTDNIVAQAQKAFDKAAGKALGDKY